MHKSFRVLWITLAICSLLACGEAAGWIRKASEIPEPRKQYAACGVKGPSAVCNIDNLLSDVTVAKVNHITDELHEWKPPTRKDPCGRGFELGVLIVQNAEGVTDSDEAGVYARKVHDKWGVGSKECNNGVLLFIAVDNRKMYISTGKGARPYLPDYVIHTIIDNMKPYLRQAQYDQAVLYAVDAMVTRLKTDISWWRYAWETFLDWLPVIFFTGFAALVVGAALNINPFKFIYLLPSYAYYRIREMIYKTEYNKRREQLAKLRAELNAKKQIPTTMCAICLGEFETQQVPVKQEATGTDEKDEKDEKQSDNQAEESDFDTIDATEARHLDAEGKEMRPLGSSPPTTQRSLSGSKRRKSKQDAGKEGEMKTVIVDKDHETLACGHVFHETCIGPWLLKKDSCPVCRRPDPRRGDNEDDDKKGGGGEDPDQARRVWKRMTARMGPTATESGQPVEHHPVFFMPQPVDHAFLDLAEQRLHGQRFWGLSSGAPRYTWRRMYMQDPVTHWRAEEARRAEAARRAANPSTSSGSSWSSSSSSSRSSWGGGSSGGGGGGGGGW